MNIPSYTKAEQRKIKILFVPTIYVHKINTSASVNGRAMDYIQATKIVEILKPGPYINNT